MLICCAKSHVNVHVYIGCYAQLWNILDSPRLHQLINNSYNKPDTAQQPQNGQIQSLSISLLFLLQCLLTPDMVKKNYGSKNVYLPDELVLNLVRTLQEARERFLSFGLGHVRNGPCGIGRRGGPRPI